MYDEFEAGTTKYQLNLIYLLDTSGSMYGEPINQLNVAMAEAIQVAEEAAMEKEVQLLMRVVEFNSVAKWLIGDTRQGVEHIHWTQMVELILRVLLISLEVLCIVNFWEREIIALLSS